MDLNLTSILPPASTQVAESWDHLYWFLFIVTAVFFAVVMIPMLVFMIKYRARPGRKSVPIDHNAPLEVLWTAVPTVILMVIFAWGYIVYRDMAMRPPAEAMEIRVVAKSWGWTFQYEDGRIENNRMFVPVNKPVNLVMTTEPGDVLHSFFVPNFRIKKDLVPGLYTTTYFTARDVGRHIYFCTEYCGIGHSQMWGEVIVLSDADWQLWKFGKEIELPPWVGVGGLAEKLLAEGGMKTEGASIFAQATASPQEDLAVRGATLSRKMGCVACHSSDGSESIGPSFKGLFGSERQLVNGESIVADENYIRRSIEYPQDKVVKGYEDRVMPPYPGHLSELELNALVFYIRSLK